MAATREKTRPRTNAQKRQAATLPIAEGEPQKPGQGRPPFMPRPGAGDTKGAFFAVSDPELACIAQVQQIFGAVTEDIRTRALQYLVGRYPEWTAGLHLPPAPIATQEAAAAIAE